MKRVFLSMAAGLLAVVLTAGAADAQARYVRYSQAGGPISWGALEGETIHQLADAPYLNGARTGRTVQRSAVKLEAPVDPKTVIMTAFNFRSHIQGEPAAYPGLFMVPASSIIGPEDAMIRPADAKNFHYEAELAVVIGRRADNVSVEDAPNYIFGVTAGNDGSERAWQAADIQWLRAKGTKTFNQVGPVLVQGLDYNHLMIVGRLNGEERQRESTADLIFDMNEMVSYISTYIVLEPGDMVWSGTMGATRAMQPGDVYEVEVEGVGVLRTRVEQGK